MTSPTSTQASQERRAARFWGLFIVGLFGINVAVAIIAIIMASGDPSFRPIPGYGDHGIDWQTRKSQLQQSEELEWNVTIERIVAPKLSSGKATVAVTLKDRDGIAIDNCTGSAKLYHYARVSDVFTSSLIADEKDTGRYHIDIDVSRNGTWHIEIEIRRDGKLAYLIDKRFDWFDEMAGEAKHD